jgi:C4-dicarboxylate transporter, DctM subunit
MEDRSQTLSAEVLIGFAEIIAVLLLIFVGMYVGVAMALVGYVGYIFLGGFGGAMVMLATVPYTTVAHYSMSCVPLYVLMGAIAFEAGLVKELLLSSNRWIGHLPGGLAMSTIAGCAVFAACTASSVASVGFITTSVMPEMERYKYNSRLSGGAIAAGSTLGILIPPSTGFIIYGIVAEQSIGKLFMAGLVPGIILSLLFMAVIYTLVRINPSLAPKVNPTAWRERISTLKEIWSVLLLAVIVMGGIWGGVFTPIEAGGIGAFCALVIGLAKRKLNKEKMIKALLESVKASAMIFFIVSGVMLFTNSLAISGATQALAKTVAGLALPTAGILTIIIIFYIIAGMFMDSLAMLLLSLPIFIPIIQTIKVDPILFGVIVVIMLELAMITPPVGINVYIIAGIRKDIPMDSIFKGVAPFCVAMIVLVYLIIFFPAIALWLPNTMMR